MSIDGIYLNIIKVIHNKSTVKIIFSAQMPKGFPLRSRKRQGCPHLPFLFNTALEVLATEIRQEKEIKDIYIRCDN